MPPADVCRWDPLDLASTRHTCQFSRRGVLRQQEVLQHGHDGIAVLSPFTLMDHVGVAAVVSPD